MTISELQTLLNSGQFHHATYRDHGTIWEGLYIYCNAQHGFRGFEHCGSFLKGRDSDCAYELVKGTGVSAGSYGQG